MRSALGALHSPLRNYKFCKRRSTARSQERRRVTSNHAMRRVTYGEGRGDRNALGFFGMRTEEQPSRYEVHLDDTLTFACLTVYGIADLANHPSSTKIADSSTVQPFVAAYCPA